MKSISSLRQRLGRSQGFTLIELLIVITVIVLLMALAAPSFVGTMQSSRLAAAGQNLLGRLSQAQQTASSTNIPVEVRFYKFDDPTHVGGGDYFGAYQFLLARQTINASGAATETMETLSSPFYLESGVYISGGQINGSPASALITGTGVSTFDEDGTTTAAGVNSGVTKQIQRTTGKANYVAIRFFPDGTVKRLGSGYDGSLGGGIKVRQLQMLNLPDAYVSIVGEKELTSGTASNYYTVQIDPYTGHCRSYQPGF
jgi:uncharacterized protein (TIGR02596 family)